MESGCESNISEMNPMMEDSEDHWEESSTDEKHDEIADIVNTLNRARKSIASDGSEVYMLSKNY